MRTTNFYVYAWCDTRYPCVLKYLGYTFEYLPFYIGKGCGKRDMELWGRSVYFQNKYAKIKRETGNNPQIVRVTGGLNEKDAFTLEVALIQAIGRMDLKTGPLVNYTSGGEGNSGREISKETRSRLSNSLKGVYVGVKHHMFGKNHSEATKLKMSRSLSKEKNPFYGKHHSDETKKRLSNMQTGKHNGEKNPMFGKTHSTEAREKISKTHKGRKLSVERKQQIGMFFKGTQQSPEHIAKKVSSYKATVKIRRIDEKKKYQVIWRKIESLMAIKNITATELSKKSGVGLPNISSMKYGVRGIGPKTLKRFSSVLGNI